MSQTSVLYEAKFVIFNEYIVSPLKYVTYFCFIPAFLSSVGCVCSAKAVRKVMNFQSYISVLFMLQLYFLVRCQMFQYFCLWMVFLSLTVIACKYSAQKGEANSTASSQVCWGQLCCKISHTPVLKFEQSAPILFFLSGISSKMGIVSCADLICRMALSCKWRDNAIHLFSLTAKIKYELQSENVTEVPGEVG